MNNIGVLIPILGIMCGLVAIFGGVVVRPWLRFKEREMEIHKSEGPQASRKIELLTNENESMKGKMGRLEERIAVLERIATDPATRTAREIEQLRFEK
jgi:hypothetical protein